MSARMLANDVLKSAGMVLPDTGHQLKTFLESAASHEPKMHAIDRSCFTAKLAPGKALRYSPKEREYLIAYQERAMEVCGGNVNDILINKPLSDFSSAPHRWESDEKK